MSGHPFSLSLLVADVIRLLNAAEKTPNSYLISDFSFVSAQDSDFEKNAIEAFEALETIADENEQFDQYCQLFGSDTVLQLSSVLSTHTSLAVTKVVFWGLRVLFINDELCQGVGVIVTPEILKHLKEHENNGEIVRVICGCLRNLFAEDLLCEQFGFEFVPLLIELLKKYANDKNIIEEICACFANLLDSESISEEYGDTIFPLLLDFLKSSEGTEITKIAIGCLRDLFAEERFREKYGKTAFQLINNIFKANASDPNIVEVSCGCLRNLFADDFIRETYGKESIEEVHKALQKHIEHFGVIEKACGCLRNLFADDAVCETLGQTVITTMHSIISSIDKNTAENKAEPLSAALRCFANLLCNENIRKQFGAKCITDLLNLLESQSDSEDVVVSTLCCLRNVFSGETFLSSFGQNAICALQKVFAAHSNSEEITRHGCTCLFNILASPELRKKNYQELIPDLVEFHNAYEEEELDETANEILDCLKQFTKDAYVLEEFPTLCKIFENDE